MKVSFTTLRALRLIHDYETLVLVGGCYDLLHVGHIEFLKACKKLGDRLIVSVSSDARVRERKGPERPIINETDRATMLSSLSVVDYVVIAPNPGREVPTVVVINELRPDVFATSDHNFESYARALSAQGTKVVHVPEIRKDSTTGIIERIRNRGGM